MLPGFLCLAAEISTDIGSVGPPRPIATKHIYAGDTLIATVEGEGANAIIHYIHGDHLSGSHVVTDGLSNLEEVTDYHPYGKINFDQILGTFDENRKFTGHQYDAVTEFTYMKARYYDGKTARFMSPDPAFLSVGMSELEDKTGIPTEEYLSDPQQLNSYSYVRNNPLKHKDPTGEWYKEFATGNQSWQSFQAEIGQAANQLSNDSGTWNYAINHPYISGGAIGIMSAPAIQAGVSGIATLSTIYPSGSLAYSVARAIEAGVYFKVAEKTLRSIPNIIDGLEKIGANDPQLKSLGPAITNTVWDTAKKFSKESGSTADSDFIFSLIRNVGRELEKYSVSGTKNSPINKPKAKNKQSGQK